MVSLGLLSVFFCLLLSKLSLPTKKKKKKEKINQSTSLASNPIIAQALSPLNAPNNKIHTPIAPPPPRKMTFGPSSP
jgi:hypothetical protein